MAVLFGLGLLAAAPASASPVRDLRLTGTWNLRATPGGTLIGKVHAGPVTVDCQADGPTVNIPGTGRTAIWNRIPGRGYVTDLAVAGTADGKRDPRIPSCGGTAPQPPRSSPTSSGYGAAVLARAKNYPLNSYGGQCKVWAAKVVNAVLLQHGSRRIGGYESRDGAYWGSYVNAGGVRVAVSQAAPGDLIQTNNPNDRTSNVHYRAMHSAIIVSLTGTPGTFVVRDSNWGGNELVTEHLWTPDVTAKRFGLETNIWHFGGR
jgi:hypothetical protein